MDQIQNMHNSQLPLTTIWPSQTSAPVLGFIMLISFVVDFNCFH